MDHHPDLEGLRERLHRARRRLERAAPHSPEWDAAIEAVEELTDLCRRAETSTAQARLGAA